MKINCQGKPEGCKLLRIEAELSDGRVDPVIISIVIRGDFFAIPEERFDALEASLAGLPLEGFAAAFNARAKEQGIQMAGIHGEGVELVIRSGLHGA
ncbi:MAG: hypothetical protein RBT72_07665 [Spirochaetia bacterium]|jgi:hypothetical protein|nr:hypothetical protein [Spirochaetia bacterium]